MGGDGEGKVLYEAKFTWFAWFGNEGEGGGLKRAESGFNFCAREGPEVSAFGKLLIYDLVKYMAVLNDRGIVWG